MEVEQVRNNKYSISLNGKSIPTSLLPQEAGVIEIPVRLVKSENIQDSDNVLFNININNNGTINTKRPLKAISRIDETINDYSDIINILQSIQTPISRNTFIDLEDIGGKLGFIIGDKFYYYVSPHKPLGVIAV